MEGISREQAQPASGSGSSPLAAIKLMDLAAKLGMDRAWTGVWLGHRTARKSAYRAEHRIRAPGATAGLSSSAAAATNVAELRIGPHGATSVSQTGPHRKRVKYYHEPGDVHLLTFSCFRRMPLLTNDDWRRLLCQAIDRAIERHAYRLFAFFLMPMTVTALAMYGSLPYTKDWR